MSDTPIDRIEWFAQLREARSLVNRQGSHVDRRKADLRFAREQLKFSEQIVAQYEMYLARSIEYLEKYEAELAELEGQEPLE
jgi:hypothetical protein